VAKRHKGGQSFADYRSHHAIRLDTPTEPSTEPSGMGLNPPDKDGPLLDLWHRQARSGATHYDPGAWVPEARDTFSALVPDRYKVKG
jgi:hypothetical protein